MQHVDSGCAPLSRSACCACCQFSCGDGELLTLEVLARRRPSSEAESPSAWRCRVTRASLLDACCHAPLLDDLSTDATIIVEHLLPLRSNA